MIKKLLFSLSLSFLLVSSVFAQDPTGPPIEIREIDLDPSIYYPTILEFPNGSLTDNDAGYVVIDFTAPLAGVYLKLDCSNDPLTNQLDGADFDFTGHAAIGADASVSAVTILDIDETLTFVDTTGYGIFAQLDLVPSGVLGAATHLIAMDMQAHWNGTVDGSVHASVQGIKGEGVNISDAVAGHINEIVGVYGKASNIGSTDVTTAIAGLFTVTNDDGFGDEDGAITNAYSLLARAYTDKTTDKITNRYGLYVEDTTGGGDLDNQYGLYIPALTAGGTLNYGAVIMDYVGLGTATPLELLHLKDGDLLIEGPTPHIELRPDAGDAFEFYSFGSESYWVNKTDSQVFIKIRADDRINFYDISGYTFPKTAPADNQIWKFDALLGRMAWEADLSGTTAYDDIGDPDAAGSISFDDGETATYTTIQDSAASFFNIINTNADVSNLVTLLKLQYTDDGQDLAHFLTCNDNAGDVKFFIQEEGKVEITPGGAGSANIFRITPSAVISTNEAIWNAISINGAALDPSGDDVFLCGLGIDFSGVVPTGSGEDIDGMQIKMASGEEHAIHIEEGKVVIDNTAGAAAGAEYTVVDIRLDTSSLDTNSDIHAIDVAVEAGTPSGKVVALGTHSNVDPIAQGIGTFSIPNQDEYAGKKITAGSVWVDGDTPAIGEDLDGNEMFKVNDDEIYVGSAAVFNEIEVDMATAATKNITPEFYYNTAADLWTEFFPADDTDGFQQDGIIRWTLDDISGSWTNNGLPGGADCTAGYWIKIIRTSNADPGTPTPTTVKTGVITNYFWDKTGAIDVLSMEADTITEGGVGVYNINEITAAVVEAILVDDPIDFGTGAVSAAEFNLSDGEFIEWGTDENITFNATSQDFIISDDWILKDASPFLGLWDTTTDTGIVMHFDNVADTQQFGFFRGTFDANGVFTTVTPFLTFDTSDNATINAGTLTVGEGIIANLTGNVTGNVTGNLSGDITTTSNIKGEPKHLIFNLWNPNGIQGDDGEVCIWPVTDAALTITKITITLDAAGNEILGDLKYCTAFIGLTGAVVVINDFDTSSGVRVDSSITAGAVPVGQAIYLSFDSSPNAAITQACFDIEWDYD